MSAGIINTGTSPKLLWPGLNQIWGMSFKAHAPQYVYLFDKSTSEKNYEEDVALTSFGLVPQKPEGSATQYDSFNQLYISRYTHITYALGFIITYEALKDNLYMQMGEKGAKALAWSYNQTLENVAHNIYNNGFDNTVTYGDGQPFFSTSHPYEGGTYSNILSPGADLSEAALEQILINIGNAVDNRGLKIDLKAKSLHVPVQLQFEAKRILGDPDRPGTADRDINAMYHMGMFPEGFKVHNYFTDPDAYFVRTDTMDAVRYFEREAPRFTNDNEFDTENQKYKTMGRYSVGVTDPRGAFASQGA
jgi:hypothetical protein